MVPFPRQRSIEDVFSLELAHGRKFALASLGRQERDPLAQNNELLSPSLARTQGVREKGSKCGGEKIPAFCSLAEFLANQCS